MRAIFEMWRLMNDVRTENDGGYTYLDVNQKKYSDFHWDKIKEFY